MTRKEILYLRNKLQEEKMKRDRLKELINIELIQEFITLANIKSNKYKINDDEEILKNILKKFIATETNGIYVCTGAYYIRSVTCRGFSDDYEAAYLPFDSEYIERKEYRDIESREEIIGYLNKNEMPHWKDKSIVYTPKFEREHLVLNPYNKSDGSNGYEEVRQEFLEKCLKYGQAKSKKLLLKKYPRMEVK